MKEQTNFIKKINFVQPISQLLDILSVIASGIIAYHIRDFPVPVDQEVYTIAIVLGAFYASIIFRIFGTYNQKNNYKIQYPLQRVIISWFGVMVLLALTAYLTKTGEYFSRLWFIVWAINGLLLLIIVKIVFLSILYSEFFKKWHQKNIILVGTSKHSEAIAKQINQLAYSDLNILGQINIPISNESITDSCLHILGEIQDINQIIDNLNVHEVWITLPLKAEDSIKQILYLLRHSTVDIRMIPDIFELRLLNQSITDIAGIPVINLCESPMSGANKFYKLLEDKILASLILLFCIPLFILIPLTIILTSEGPIFYFQNRIGWNGKVFKIIKFRTMPVDAEKSTGPVWSKFDDRRATTFGSFLRRSSLDELPQFINVLKGDMSIVGPRPERPEFVQEFKEQIPGYMKKHMVKAGITGWAQINGWRGDTDLSTRISHDLYYIENWSIMFDLKIIALTIVKGFSNIHAY